MNTSRTLRLFRYWIFALVLAGTSVVAPAALRAANHPEAQIRAPDAKTPVLPAAWYDHVLNSRARTIQVVFIAVLIGAYMLRRSS